MSRQDKATTERHAKILREMVKRPENKMCADCKRNDARWASWNIGVFICIRCSGIHRSMGTHISKVKSVDLDTWTPQQMERIQRWGNHRANLYWEAHLRPGHSPPEHKMESFIRSKYESRRWALEGPPPADPAELENSEAPTAAASSPTSSEQPSLVSPAPTLLASVTATARQPRPHQLLSTTASRPLRATAVAAAAPMPDAAPAPAPAPAPSAANELFSLDFHSPATPANNQRQSEELQSKDKKQDILSLFSTAPKPAAANGFGSFGQFTSAPAQPQGDAFTQWGQMQSSPLQPKASVAPTMATNGTASWGMQGVWNAPPAQAAPPQPSAWGWSGAAQAGPIPPQPQPTQGIFESQSVWGSSTAAGTIGDLFGTPFSSPAVTSATQKKDDAFGDLWGDFK